MGCAKREIIEQGQGQSERSVRSLNVRPCDAVIGKDSAEGPVSVRNPVKETLVDLVVADRVPILHVDVYCLDLHVGDTCDVGLIN